jgi:hypothetical protein
MALDLMIVCWKPYLISFSDHTLTIRREKCSKKRRQRWTSRLSAKPNNDLAKKAEALRRQQEAERQQYEAQKQQLYQQQQAAANAAGQASRQQSWYTKPIGVYDLIKPINPRGGGQ